jgi:hypothetical protein
MGQTKDFKIEDSQIRPPASRVDGNFSRTSHPVNGCNCDKYRIDALEASNKRVEDMLRKMCGVLGQTKSGSGRDLKIPITCDHKLDEGTGGGLNGSQ